MFKGIKAGGFFLQAVAFFLIVPNLAVAYTPHGGFEKVAGSVIVFVTQTPISPLADENVHMTLVFKNSAYNALPDMPVRLALVSTQYGDASKDSTLLSENLVTDVNGSLDFHYAFPQEGYYDIEFSFIDPETGKTDETDFLIQARSVPAFPTAPLLPAMAAFCLGVLSAGAAVFIIRKKKAGE